MRALGRADEALEIHYELLATGDSGFAYEETGECLFALGNREAAKPYFAEAFARLAGNVDDERLQRLGELSYGSTFGQLSTNAIRFVRTPHAKRKAIWRMVATPEGIAQWLGTVVGPIDTPNSEVVIQIESDPNDAVKCRVMDYLPPKTLTLGWDAAGNTNSILSFEVADNRLTLKHRNPSDLATYGAAWHSALDLIAHLLGGNPKETFTENYQYLFPEYQQLMSRQGIL